MVTITAVFGAAVFAVAALAGSNRVDQWRYERQKAAEARDRHRAGTDA